MDQSEIVFLDANVLFTAAYNPLGLAASLIRQRRRLHLEMVTSTYVVNEALHNLQLKNPEKMKNLKEILLHVSVKEVCWEENFNPLHLPLDDAPIFHAALVTKSTHLLTGDLKAFGPWMNKPKMTCGILIQIVRHFVDQRIL